MINKNTFFAATFTFLFVCMAAAAWAAEKNCNDAKGEFADFLKLMERKSHNSLGEIYDTYTLATCSRKSFIKRLKNKQKDMHKFAIDACRAKGSTYFKNNKALGFTIHITYWNRNKSSYEEFGPYGKSFSFYYLLEKHVWVVPDYSISRLLD